MTIANMSGYRNYEKHTLGFFYLCVCVCVCVDVCLGVKITSYLVEYPVVRPTQENYILLRDRPVYMDTV